MWGMPECRAPVRRWRLSIEQGLPACITREIVWMLSELGGEESVESIARLLNDAELREDARMVLQRIPTESAVSALLAAWATSSADFRQQLALSLVARGVDLSVTTRGEETGD